MTPRAERRAFGAAAFGLWLLFFAQAVLSPVLLDDWFQLRYWRDHEFGVTALWAYAHHNYFHYNPRLGEVLLAIVDGSRAFHVIATPLVQTATLPIVFAIAFARWPRPTLRDLQLLLFIQTMIWLVIPIPGIMYFYRPFATNYLWAFTITLGLFVPYRLALSSAPRGWLAPMMLVLGWCAGMCNEHTGPTAMVAMACFVYAAWRRRRLRAWMVAGMVGLYIGYPMLFFAPGQHMRYGGIALRETPLALLAERGVGGCLAIFGNFLFESRLGILVFVAAAASYALTLRRRGERFARPPRHAVTAAAVLAAAAAAIVMTLFVSPTVTDRVFYGSGVLLVAAFAISADHMFGERSVRRVVTGACIVVFAYHVVRFVDTAVAVHAENVARLAQLAAASPGSVPIVPTYDGARRTRWQLGDDFASYPWLHEYVGGELYDLAGIDLTAPPSGGADRRAQVPAIDLTAPPSGGADRRAQVPAIDLTAPPSGGADRRAQVPAIDLTAPPSGGADRRAQVPAIDLTAPPSGGADRRAQVPAIDLTAPPSGGADRRAQVPAIDLTAPPSGGADRRAQVPAIDLTARDQTRTPHLVTTRTRGGATFSVPGAPTYRQLQAADLAAVVGPLHADPALTELAITAPGVFDDPQRRPLVVFAWSPAGYQFVDGAPHDSAAGHFVRVRGASVPPLVEAAYMVGCTWSHEVDLAHDDAGGSDLMLAVDERYCRGPFTAVVCAPDRCWVAGWY